jgi:flagellar biosynthesis/type III secretory pathway chaperone
MPFVERRSRSVTTTTVAAQPIVQQQQQHVVQQQNMIHQRSSTRSPCCLGNNSNSEQQLYRRELKINLTAKPKPCEATTTTEEYNYMNAMDETTKTLTTTTLCPTPPPPPRITTTHTMTNIMTVTPVVDTQEEVLLNLFSCNNSGSLSSESSESLVDLDETAKAKLKINEVYEKREERKQPEQCTKRITNQQNLLLEKRLAELERKLQKIPELEIKNNILMEEKQLLLKQILNMKQQQQCPPPPCVKIVESTKVCLQIFFEIFLNYDFCLSVKKK